MADIDIVVRARAGCGKSTLAHELKLFLEMQGFTVSLGTNETIEAVNLRHQGDRMNALRAKLPSIEIETEHKPRS